MNVGPISVHYRPYVSGSRKSVVLIKCEPYLQRAIGRNSDIDSNIDQSNA